MKLLICTQAVDVNHPILGFFHGWIEEFAKHCEEVHVICLIEGEHHLPPNVHVYSLGKEEGENKLKYVYRFYKYCWQLRDRYDNVFVHMNQIYVIMGGVFWKVWHKRIGLWYMHKSVTISLRIAEKIVNEIFTGTKESFRLSSKKLRITGHGIDTVLFSPKEIQKDIDLITVGRLTPSKNLEALIEVLAGVREAGHDVSLTIVGAPLAEGDREYLGKLKEIIRDKELTDYVHFYGSVSNQELPELLARARVFVHAATNGSLDKAVLESLAVGVPVISSAEGVLSLPLRSWFATTEATFVDSVGKVLNSDNTVESYRLRESVMQNHSILSLIPMILNRY